MKGKELPGNRLSPPATSVLFLRERFCFVSPTENRQFSTQREHKQSGASNILAERPMPVPNAYVCRFHPRLAAGGKEYRHAWGWTASFLGRCLAIPRLGRRGRMSPRILFIQPKIRPRRRLWGIRRQHVNHLCLTFFTACRIFV